VTDTEGDGFYSLRDVGRLAGIPMRTLYNWRLRGIISPSLESRSGNTVEEGYAYADLTIIRLIRALREDRIDFEAAKKALSHMYTRLGPPSKGWAGERVYFVGRSIFVEGQDEWPITDATKLGQTVAPVLFGDLFGELRDLEDGSSILIPKHFRPYVHIDPKVLGGEPVVRGTRLPTSMLGALAQARGVAAVVRMYASLVSPKILRQAIAFERHLDLQAT
jgi:uncharacterized protein (DUF433 family)